MSGGSRSARTDSRQSTGRKQEMAIGVGDTLPDVTLHGLDGETVTLGRLRGKRRLLFFWGSW